MSTLSAAPPLERRAAALSNPLVTSDSAVITQKRLDKEDYRNPGIIISNSITGGVIDDSALANTRTLKRPSKVRFPIGAAGHRSSSEPAFREKGHGAALK
jgi:hypothetical protein